MMATFPGTSPRALAPRSASIALIALMALVAGCGDSADDGAPGARGAPTTGGAGGNTLLPTAGTGGASASGSGGATLGTAGTSGAGGASGAGTAGASGAGAGAAGDGAQAGSAATTPPPASCGDAARAYTVTTSALDASLVPDTATQSWGAATPRTPVAIDEAAGLAYVAFTRLEGSSRSVVIAAEGSAPADVITIADAAIGGLAVTNDGVAALLFDPNPSTDDRTWVAVARFGADGTEAFKTDLFHSPNLDDEGTKGAPTTGRLGYVPATDQLIAYFGHTQRYDDGVRHQGGYLASLDAAGAQTVIEGWFGSHNLDQRLLVDGDRVALLGLGDAFPKGIFFTYTDDARTNVIYRLAADGVGATNGQLGGLLNFADQLIAPFVTNRSIAQDLDAGPWPDTDETISMQIRDAAAAGTDLGLLPIPKTALPGGDLAPTWLDAAVASGARISSLKSAQYGSGELVLLGWAETTGERFNASSLHYTMVVDRAGAVCQPKTQLPAAQAFTAGDDIVRRADGRLVWANAQGGSVQFVTLTP